MGHPVALIRSLVPKYRYMWVKTQGTYHADPNQKEKTQKGLTLHETLLKNDTIKQTNRLYKLIIGFTLVGSGFLLDFQYDEIVQIH